MCAMSVPPQITSLAEIAKEPTTNTVAQQWYEETLPKPENVEGKDQNQKIESPVIEVKSQEVTNTLIPSNEQENVVDTTKDTGKQDVTTLVASDQITSLADATENEVIEEINAAHGTK